MAFKSNSAERVVNRPFPCCIGVAVEYNPSLDFAGRLFVSGYVVAGSLFEEEVDGLLVKTELKENDDKAEYN